MTYPHKLWCQRKETVGAEKRDLVALGRQVERHWPVLEALEAPAFLTADHVGLLLYADMQKATKVASGKLHRLFELGLVNAFRFSRAGAEGPGGSAPLIYHLSRDGAQLLAARKEVSVSDLLWHERQELLSTAGVCHRLDLADLHCALVAHCTRQGMTLKRFAYEPRIELPKIEGSEIREVWPDGLVDIQGPGGQEVALLVEVDRDTERPRRFAERVNRYEALWRSSAWEAVLPAAPTVLVVVTDGGRSRMEALREATAAALHKTEARFKRYRFAVMEDLYRVERSAKGYTAQVMTAFDKTVCVKASTNDLVPLLGGGGE